MNSVSRKYSLPFTIFIVAAVFLVLSGCAGEAQVQAEMPLDVQTGQASFYGSAFHGKETASGEIFDMNEMVAAHPTYPLGTLVRVINLENNRSVELQIIDRGPAKGPRAAGVIIDVSRGAAQTLNFVKDGRTDVRVEVLEWGEGR
jgi:rare lipoprotein A